MDIIFFKVGGRSLKGGREIMRFIPRVYIDGAVWGSVQPLLSDIFSTPICCAGLNLDQGPALGLYIICHRGISEPFMIPV